jgi:hypothetical protein
MGRNTKYKMQYVDYPVIEPASVPGIDVPKTNYGVSIGGKDAPELGADVTAEHISAGFTGQGALATLDEVDTLQIVDEAISTAKLALESVTEDVLADEAVTASKVTTGELITLAAQIKDATIVDAHIANLSVSKLTAGTIASQAIALATTVSQGDVYIAGGNNIEFTYWTGGDDEGGAVILGIDQSDGNKGKFFAGNYYTNKYLRFDGENTDATGIRYIDVYTAGETIEAGEPVSLGHGQAYGFETQYNGFDFAQIAERVPDTCYYPVSAINVGLERPISTTYKKWGLVNFSLNDWPENFYDFFVYLYCTTGAVGGDSMDVTVYPITSAWDPTTVTWNTKPTKNDSYSGSFTILQGSAVNWYGASGNLIDWIIRCKLGLETFRGFMITGTPSNTDNGSTNINVGATPPGMRGRRLVDEDQVFVSKSAIIAESYGSAGQEYRCYNFVGFAVEGATVGQELRIQTSGLVSGLSGLIPGADYYISNSKGEITTSQDLTSGFPVYKIGRAMSTTTLMIEKGEKSCALTGVPNGYFPTYFMPKAIETHCLTTRQPDILSYGIYENNKQYCAGAADKLFYYTSGGVDSLEVTYILPGGVYFTAVNSGYMGGLGRIKG